MFNKKIKIKDRIIEIAIFDKVFCKDKNNIIFGFPLISKDSLLKSKKFSKNTKGIWAKINIKNNEVKITTDILGGFRLYYTKKENMIFISDQYDYLITKQNQKLSINNQEYTFWKKHRYTSGGSTFFNIIKKINPASSLTITKNQIIEDSYFNDIFREKNITKHSQKIDDDLEDTFLKIKKIPKKKVLFFSGGKDSCLLANYLIKNEIDFSAIYLHFEYDNVEDELKKVKLTSKKIGFKIEIIKIKENEIDKKLENEILKKQLFDRHISKIQYYGCKIIQKKYGNDVLLINGQSSDSILSFGPSENTLMSYFRRKIMYFPESIISKIGLLLLIIKEKTRFYLPKNEAEKLYALFDDYKYTRVIKSNLDKEYHQYFQDYLSEKTKGLHSYHSKEMLCKILSFCQGSDNQVVINSAKHFNLKVIMPFATPKIIYSTIKFKDDYFESKKPKYVVDKILENKFNFTIKSNFELGFLNSIIFNSKNIVDNNYLKKYEKYVTRIILQKNDK